MAIAAPTTSAARGSRPEGDRGDRADHGDDHDLQERARHHDPPDARELAQRELDTQREQQQDDTQLREGRDPVDVAHEARGERPDDTPATR